MLYFLENYVSVVMTDLRPPHIDSLPSSIFLIYIYFFTSLSSAFPRTLVSSPQRAGSVFVLM